MTNHDNLRGPADALRQRFRPAATPPTYPGKILATLPRPREHGEIRIGWCQYEGRPFIRLQLWRRGQNGAMYPVKERDVTIRLAELPDLADAVAEALTL